MKKYINPILFILISIFSTTLLAAPVISPGLAKIKASKKLIVGMYYKDQPPFFFHNKQHQFVGIDVQLAKNIGKKLHVQVVFDRSYKTFNSIVAAVENHKVDVAISYLSKTLPRLQRVNFSTPYIVLHQGLMINRLLYAKIPHNINILKTLNHPKIKIGILAHSAFEDYVKVVFPNATYVRFHSWQPGIEALKLGELTALLMPEDKIKGFILKHPAASISIKTVIIKDLNDDIAIAVPWNYLQLLNWLNGYLEQQYIKLNLDEILHHYKDYL